MLGSVTTDDVRHPTARAYDRVVDDYVRRNSEVPQDFAAFRTAFVAEVRPGGRVADLGCGPGRDAGVFRAAGLTVLGVDASQQMARRTRSTGIPVARGDIRRPPLRPACLDGIWSAASLLHVPRGEVAATLRAWWSCLDPGGALGLSTSLGDGEGWEPWPDDPASQASTGGLRRWFVHHSADSLLDQLEATGFVVADARERVGHRRWLQVVARCRPEP
jgi:SAM-dependent methyltransferase